MTPDASGSPEEPAVLTGAAVLASGLLVLAAVLTGRWVVTRLWHRELVVYRLELPRRLTHDQVSDWLAALGSATRHIPVVIEIVATRMSATPVINRQNREAPRSQPMSLIDFAVDFALDCLMEFRALSPERVRQVLLANVLQTVALSGGLV